MHRALKTPFLLSWGMKLPTGGFRLNHDGQTHPPLPLYHRQCHRERSWKTPLCGGADQKGRQPEQVQVSNLCQEWNQGLWIFNIYRPAVFQDTS